VSTGHGQGHGVSWVGVSGGRGFRGWGWARGWCEDGLCDYDRVLLIRRRPCRGRHCGAACGVNSVRGRARQIASATRAVNGVRGARGEWRPRRPEKSPFSTTPQARVDFPSYRVEKTPRAFGSAIHSLKIQRMHREKPRSCHKPPRELNCQRGAAIRRCGI
jgi:hypothetical protein